MSMLDYWTRRLMNYKLLWFFYILQKCLTTKYQLLLFIRNLALASHIFSAYHARKLQFARERFVTLPWFSLIYAWSLSRLLSLSLSHLYRIVPSSLSPFLSRSYIASFSRRRDNHISRAITCLCISIIPRDPSQGIYFTPFLSLSLLHGCYGCKREKAATYNVNQRNWIKHARLL